MTLQYQHLIGRHFIHGKVDCYDMIRCFYRDNFGIELTNYARPDGWWDEGLDLYNQNFRKEGFKVVGTEARDALPADVILMAIQSEQPNHAGIYLGGGEFLHHYYGKISKSQPYTGLWRKTTTVIIRHKDVTMKNSALETVDFMDLVSEPLRCRISSGS